MKLSILRTFQKEEEVMRRLIWIGSYLLTAFLGYEVDEIKHSSQLSPAFKKNGVAMQSTCPDAVFSCMDNLVRGPIATWIDQELEGQAVLLCWPGVSEVINNERKREFALEALGDAQEIKRITDLHLFNHRNCGGHGGSARHNHDLEAEYAYHLDELAKARQIVKNRFPGINVHLHFLEANGDVSDVFPPEPIPVGELSGLELVTP
jgi:hypothetical protein